MEKRIIITNGAGEEQLINGQYSVTADVNGYDNSSITPSNVNLEDGTNELSFTITASGTLTIHVTEDGTSTGTPVVGATFVRTDSTGTEYGNVITTDSEGNAVFANVPFCSTGAPIIYFKQTASDGDHEFSSEVQNTSMQTDTETIEIQNAAGALRTINLTDANYENLPIESGTIILTN